MSLIFAEFKAQCLKSFCYHGNKSTLLLFYSISRTTPKVSSKLYFVEICYVSEKLWLFNHKRADFWLPNFGFKRSLLSLLEYFSHVENNDQSLVDAINTSDILRIEKMPNFVLSSVPKASISPASEAPILIRNDRLTSREFRTKTCSWIFHILNRTTNEY